MRTKHMKRRKKRNATFAIICGRSVSSEQIAIEVHRRFIVN